MTIIIENFRAIIDTILVLGIALILAVTLTKMLRGMAQAAAQAAAMTIIAVLREKREKDSVIRNLDTLKDKAKDNQ